MLIQGYDITSAPLDLPRDTWKFDEKGITCTRTIVCVYANFTAVVPSIYDPHPLNISLLYDEADVVQEEEIGELCLVTLRYSQQNYSGPATTPLPKPQWGTNGGKVEEDIRRHPNFTAPSGSATGSLADANSPWSQFWDVKAKDWQSDAATGFYLSTVPSYLLGVTKFPVGATTMWTKVFYSTDPGPAPQTGRIVDPGFGFGPSGCYMLTGCDQQKENAFWARTSHFDYSVTPFPRQIITDGR